MTKSINNPEFSNSSPESHEDFDAFHNSVINDSLARIYNNIQIYEKSSKGWEHDSDKQQEGGSKADLESR